MKPTKEMTAARRFFRRFNVWLYLVCLLLAVIVWCVSMYVKDPDGLRSQQETASLYPAVSVTESL